METFQGRKKHDWAGSLLHLKYITFSIVQSCTSIQWQIQDFEKGGSVSIPRCHAEGSA